MLIERRSPLTGRTNFMDLDVTQEMFDEWRSGALIQNAFPHLTPDEREFILTGYTPEDWEAMFGGDDDEG